MTHLKYIFFRLFETCKTKVPKAKMKKNKVLREIPSKSHFIFISAEIFLHVSTFSLFFRKCPPAPATFSLRLSVFPVCVFLTLHQFFRDKQGRFKEFPLTSRLLFLWWGRKILKNKKINKIKAFILTPAACLLTPGDFGGMNRS